MSRKKPQQPAKPSVSPDAPTPWARVENLAAIALSLWILCLHLLFLFHAGPLWRDEVGTIDFASMPTVSDIWHNLQYDNFPPLFVGVARLWTKAGLSGDFSYRCLGFLVGLGTLGAFWFGARRGGIGAPLLVLALYAVNPLAIRVGDAMRPYGLGIALNVLTFVLVWKFVENPRVNAWSWAAFAAVFSVQCLYQNGIFLAAYCLAGGIVCLSRRQWKPAAQVIGIGAVAALSLLPHLGNILKGRDWLETARYAVSLADIMKFIANAANDPGAWMGWCWVALVAAAIVVAFISFLRARAWRLFYCATVIIAAVPFYFLFIKHVSLKPQSWYFLDLLAPVAMAVDLILGGIISARGRIARAALASLLTATVIPTCFAKVQIRQTNADLVAGALREHAGPQDVILVSPWYYGVALQRYYTNHFDTIPPMEELRIHRYDLMKKAMLTENPIGPLLDRVRQTLRSGHDFWVVGDFQFPPPGSPQPLLPPYTGDMNMDIPAAHYFSSWMFQFSGMVQTHAVSMGQVDIQVPGGATVSGLENMPVYLFRGWKE